MVKADGEDVCASIPAELGRMTYFEPESIIIITFFSIGLLFIGAVTHDDDDHPPELYDEINGIIHDQVANSKGELNKKTEAEIKIGIISDPHKVVGPMDREITDTVEKKKIIDTWR